MQSYRSARADRGVIVSSVSTGPKAPFCQPTIVQAGDSA